MPPRCSRPSRRGSVRRVRCLDRIEGDERRAAARELVAEFVGEVDDDAITVLTGGGSAQVFHIQRGDDHWVLRVCNAQYADPALETRVQCSAAASGSAPAVRAWSESHGILLIDYVQPHPLFVEQTADERRALLARTLRRCHAREIVAGEKPRGPAELLAFAASLLDQLELAWPALAIDVYAALRKHDHAAPSGTVRPCHNDVHPGNVLYDGCSLQLIDWESSGLGDPLFDVAYAANGFEFTPEGPTALLRSYLGRAPDPDEHVRFRRLRAAALGVYGLFTLVGTGRLIGAMPTEAEASLPPYLAIWTNWQGRFDLTRPETRQRLALAMLREAGELLRC
jgi:thiamine kinase-like enzyme